MCGIVGYVGNASCGSLLIDGLRRLEYRGYDSAGVAIHDGERVHRRRAEGKLAALEQRFREDPVEGTTGIGHTRWATHGAPVERNAHPHQVGPIVVCHNGIIENHLELREALERRGARFESETDTEIVAHLIAEQDSGTLLERVRRAVQQVRGSYGLVVLDERDPTRIVAARQASPLVVGLGDGEQFAASDVPAIMAHTRDVVFLEDGDFAELTAAAVRYEDADGRPVQRTARRILWDPIAAEKQGFKHFMLKEIHEQPDRIVDTLRGRISLERSVSGYANRCR